MLFTLRPAPGYVVVDVNRTGFVLRSPKGELSTVVVDHEDPSVVFERASPHREARAPAMAGDCNGRSACRHHGQACPELAVARRAAARRRSIYNVRAAAAAARRREDEPRHAADVEVRRLFELRLEELRNRASREGRDTDGWLVWAILALDLEVAGVPVDEVVLLSRRERNRLRHALNGNIDSALRWALGWLVPALGTSYSTTVELSPEEMITVSVSSRAAPTFVGFERDEVPVTPVFEADELATLVRAGALLQCPDCPAGSGRYRLPVTRLGNPIVARLFGRDWAPADLVWAVSPYLCRHYLARDLQTWVDSTVVHRGLPVMSPVHAPGVIPAPVRRSTCPGHPRQVVEGPATDDLGVVATGTLYRPEERNDNLRCCVCWPNDHHHTDPAFVDLLHEPGALGSLEDKKHFIAHHLRAVVQYHLSSRPGAATIVSIAPGAGYNLSADFSAPPGLVIVLHDGRAPFFGPLALPEGPWTFVPVALPQWGSPRSLALSRIIVASMMPVGTVVYTANARQGAVFAPAVTDFRPDAACPQFYRSNLVGPSAGVMRVVAGHLPIARSIRLDLLIRTAHYYGMDELIMGRLAYVIIPGFLPLTLDDAIRTPQWSLLGHATISERGGGALVAVNRPSRRRVAAAVRRLATLSAPAELYDRRAGAFEIAPDGDFDFPARRVRELAVTGRTSHVVCAVTFGTRGDNFPIRGVLRWLADHGFLVFVVPALTSAEGFAALRAAETGDYTGPVLASWGLAVAGTLSLPGLVFAPKQLGVGDVRYTYEGPTWWARPSRFALPAAVDILYRTLIDNAPVMRVGSWGDVDCVPRSTDGFSLDTFTPNRGRRERCVFVPGSSPTVSGPEGVPVLQDRDHLVALRRYDIAYVVGLGTAQTAAAAGCRVVMTSGLVDRDVRNPTNAGVGMVFGLPPSRVLSFMALADPGRALYWWQLMSWRDTWHLIRLATVRYGVSFLFSLATLMVALVRVPHKVAVGPGFVPTLLLSLLGRPSPGAVLGVSLAATVLGRLVTAYGLRGLPLLARAAMFLMGHLNDPLTYVFFYGGRGFVASAVFADMAYWLAREVLALGASAYAGYVCPKSFLSLRFFWVGVIPVMHSRFESVDGLMIAEGDFHGAQGAFVPYSWTIKTWRPGTDPEHWTLRIPTAVSWESIAAARPRAGYYSALHNCQTLLLAAVRDKYRHLGLGLLFLLPLTLFTVGSMIALLFASAATLVVLALLSPALIVAPADATRAIGFAGVKAWELLALAVAPAHDALDWTLRMTLAAQWAWSTSGSSLLAAIDDNMTASEAIGAVRDRFSAVMGFPMPESLETPLRRVLSAQLVAAPEPPRAPLAFRALIGAGRASRALYEGLPFYVVDPTDASEDLRPALQVLHAGLTDLCSVDPDAVATDLLGFVLGGIDDYWYGEANFEELLEDFEGHYGPPDAFTRTVLGFLFFADGFEEGPDPGALLDAHQLGAAGQLVANLVDDGAAFEEALSAVAQEVAAYHHVESGSTSGMDTALAMFEKYVEVSAAMKDVHLSLTEWVFQVRRWSMANGLVLYTPFEFVTLLSLRVVQDASKIAALVVQPLLLQFERAGEASPLRTGLALAFASFLDVIDVRHRVSPKPAWALLLGAHKFRMSRGDAMMANFALTTYLPPDSYEDWASKMIELMRGKDVDVDILLSTPPTRGLFFPRHTYGIKSNEQYIEGFDVSIHETGRELRRLADTIRWSGSPAIDQAWLATSEKMDVSLSRYIVERPPGSSIGHAKIIEAADSLFDDFPEMYDQPRGMTVAAAIQTSIWKYSAGLPFLPVIKKRADLKNSAWIYAIRRAAERILAGGEFPGMAFHAFPKNQLVALDRVATGTKPIRTVTAEDRITAIAYNTLAGERNKRAPPARALVLPSFRRTEGGMSSVYEQLAAQPFFVTGDAAQFDSTASSTLVVEGPVRLWARGIEGNWGERATTSWIRAYYQGLADGLIVSLYDGAVIRKTGGGGTGSAPTSVDNRDWVRICMRAAWSIVSGYPASEFKNHVVMANASDDVALGVDSMTFGLLDKWRACMYAEYGVVFSFEVREGFDGVLHLTVVDNPDYSMYATAGTQPGSVIIRHDPSRLFTMRSEYRADRARHNHLVMADVVATQACGHAMLTAHTPAAYSDIALDWEEAVSDFTLAFFSQLEFERRFNPDGILVGSTVHVTDTTPGHWLKRHARRVAPQRQDEYIRGAQKRARAWLRSRQLKSYLEVFTLWTQKPEGPTAVARRYAKIPVLPTPFVDLVRTGANFALGQFELYPKALKRLAGEPDLYTLPGQYITTDFVYEKYIFWRACDRLGRPPTHSEMSSLIRQSPFASATDLYGFRAMLASAEGESVLHPPAQEKAMVAFRVVLSLMVYTGSDFLLRRLSQLRVVGTLLSLAFAFYVGVDTVYAALSLCFWLATGTSSLQISNLVIRDPYLVLKIFSLVVSTAVPWPWVPEGLWGWLTALRWVPDVLTAGAEVRMFVPQLVNNALTLPRADIELAVDFLRRESTHSWSLVVAPMGSGKSTLFPAFLLQAGYPRVILTVPTNLLVNQYANDFVAGHLVSRVLSDTPGPLPRGGLVVMTTGLLSSRLPLTRGDGRVLSDYFGDVSGTCLLVDEVGLSSFDQAHALLVAKIFGFAAVAGLTGTPAGPLSDAAESRIIVPAARRFVLDMEEFDGSWTDEAARAVARAQQAGGRAMIIYPDRATVDRLANSLRYNLGVAVAVVDRERAWAPDSGHLVCTSIVDTGVDIRPAPVVLVDSGLAVLQMPSTIAVTDVTGRAFPGEPAAVARQRLYHRIVGWTSAPLAAQRAARVGRTANGVVFRPRARPAAPGVSPLLGIGPGTGPLLAGHHNLATLMALPAGQFDGVRALLGFQWPLEPTAEGRGLGRWLTFHHPTAVASGHQLHQAEGFALWLHSCQMGGVDPAFADLRTTRGQSEAWQSAARAAGLPEMPATAWDPSLVDRRLLACVRVLAMGRSAHRLLAFEPVENAWLAI